MNISEDMANLLYQQISHERYNAQLYLYIGSYLKNVGMDNIGEFFYEQSKGEDSHQKIVIDYLTMRNIPVKILEIPEVTEELTTLKEIADKYLSQEQLTTQKIKNIVALALEEDDMLTYQYFMEKLIKEQIEEEELATTFKDKAYMIGDDKNNWVIWDANFKL